MQLSAAAIFPAELNPEYRQKLEKIQLHDSWKMALGPFLLGEQMAQLRAFLQSEKQDQKTIYPPNHLIFNALNSTPLSDVKVVILGQDPYHGPDQAHGLSFSVPKGVALPPSLRNIFYELQTDLGITASRHGDLSTWAHQGVLLLNSVLTVVAGQPTSHKQRGWEEFTDQVIDCVQNHNQHVVFILWGAYAQRKGQRIDPKQHLILKAAHPSPLSANRGGFFGCKVFSKTNQYLQQHGKQPINWQLDA